MSAGPILKLGVSVFRPLRVRCDVEGGIRALREGHQIQAAVSPPYGLHLFATAGLEYDLITEPVDDKQLARR